MAGMYAPEPFAMERSQEEAKKHRKSERDTFSIDYSKVPRSSGDGMEYNGMSMEQTSTPSNNLKKSQLQLLSPLQSTKQTITITTSEQDVLNKGLCAVVIQSKDATERGTKTSRDLTHSQILEKRLEDKNSNDLNFSPLTQDGPTNNVTGSAMGHPTIEANLNNSSDTLSSQPANDSSKLAEHIGEDFIQSTVTEGNTEFVERQVILNLLEERNSKLIDEKTKLAVQLGIQTEVNSDLKKLLVAAIGDDLENRLEALVHRNAQLGVEVEQWRSLSQEYAEESDRLAIECDVWRTKFMASRMMSDELSCWKTTLYTRYKQTQSALQKILDERTELQHDLIQTKRLLKSLSYVVKCSIGSYKDDSILSERHSSHEQSVLELASINSCLAQGLSTQVQSILPTTSLPAQALLLTDKEECHTIEPTPAERLALQVLSCEVELQAGDQVKESSVLKRMGQQYMGHGHHSRLMTNSFRVTYDCCDRCKGPVHVV